MIDFNKFADLIENTLQNVYVTYSDFDNVLSVRLKDVNINLTIDQESNAAPDIIEKLESYYKRYFVANENLLFDIYFKNDTTAKLYIPRIVANPANFLQTLRSISCDI